jgi:enoyl-CoA hydratase/carnithine racemase
LKLDQKRGAVLQIRLSSQKPIWRLEKTVSLNEIISQDNISTITMTRGKVHAFNEEMVDDLADRFNELGEDKKTQAVILTGQGSFFSFGLDVPDLYHYTKNDFVDYLNKFTDLCTLIFTFPKPVIAAVNGHAIAGGCMLVTACDYRIMVSGKAKISLNEVTFGSMVFAGSVETLKCCVGHRVAETILLKGLMYSAEQANELGLIDRVSAPDELMSIAHEVASAYTANDLRAFTALKKLVRNPIADEMRKRDPQGNRDFADLWYTPQTRENLKGIQIRR